ncbi:receptor-like protein kinase HERK 1 isoform X1 [Zingiber officinale]|uniref:receptor-like protein kinase HERK 1 isoform X1 n=1 Tax=Zingiber officinale TaxID=94328 RepID=UPI001C4BEA29|nr:receptor-like protein kinase HERK 1 isoform X1 [Zingiber officinale]
MKGIGVSCIIFLLISIRCIHCAFTPADNYLIDCGSLTNTTIYNRVFVADVSLSSTLTSSSNNLVNTSISVPASSYGAALYQNARVFTVTSSYSFQINAHGRHFVRLYFFPSVYGNFNLTSTSFVVSTQDVVLLDHFQPQANSAVVEEFLVNITTDMLILTFAPTGNNSIAFVNAIEVVSAPDTLIADTATIVNPPGKYQGLSDQLLEKIYRVNMGGPQISPNNDTLWRNWETDQKFLLNSALSRSVKFPGKISHEEGTTEEIAPNIVYSTATELAAASNTSNAQFNVTWQFSVEANSAYLIRFHFCDIVSKAAGNLYFNVYVNSWAVASNLDLSSITFGQLATAVYMDYVLEANDASEKLDISIGPSVLNGVLPDGILNGLEIMKINGSGGSPVTPPGSKKNLVIIVAPIFGIIAVTIVVALCLILRKRKLTKQYSKSWVPFSIDGFTSHSTGSRTSNGTAFTLGLNGNFGYRLSFAILQKATNNFDENWVIGVGGFGKVYKGVLSDDTKVAVKRGNPKSQQGINEFHTEIELLSCLRHRHLVSLIGYCDEKNEMILVYEYMEKGTLKSHLYGSDMPSLRWQQRLEICIGAARGLHYLHTGQAKAIIHRDVKSANILLDETLSAKVADFGLSKTGPELDQTHVSTAVKGSFGYLDPEYFRRQQLTEKSDVYSFGVVLLEVLCARPVIDPTLPREMVNLADWGMKWQTRGELEHIVDSRIIGSIRPESLKKFGVTIEKCLADSGIERPSMGDVLWNLEYALQLQGAYAGISEINNIKRITELSPQVQNINAFESAPAGEAATSLLNDLSDDSMNKVFSQLIKSEGR